MKIYDDCKRCKKPGAMGKGREEPYCMLCLEEIDYQDEKRKKQKRKKENK